LVERAIAGKSVLRIPEMLEFVPVSRTWDFICVALAYGFVLGTKNSRIVPHEEMEGCRVYKEQGQRY